MAKKKIEQENTFVSAAEVLQETGILKNEPVSTIPVQLLETIENSGLELSKAERYALGYAPFMGEVLTQAELLKGLNKELDKDVAIAKRVSLDLGKIRSRVKDKKAEDKATLLIETRHIDNLHNLVESTLSLTQIDANEIVEYRIKVEAVQKEVLKQNRIAELLEYGVDKSYLPLDTMTEEQYAALLDDTKLAHTARIERAAREESERLQREEKARQEQAERDEAERLRLEEQERELNELKAKREQEAREFELQQQLRRENADKLVAALIFEGFEPDENELSWSKGGSWYLTYDQLADMSEDQFNDAVLKINNWNVERLAKENEERRLNEELVKQQQEKEKLQAEIKDREDREAKAEKERLAKDKAALLAPDKDKIKALFNTLEAIQIPDVKTPEAKVITQHVIGALSILRTEFINLSQKLV